MLGMLFKIYCITSWVEAARIDEVVFGAFCCNEIYLGFLTFEFCIVPSPNP
jgi:hypothetical protein